MVNAIQPSPAVSPAGGQTPRRMIPKAILHCRHNSQQFPERTLMLDQPVQIGRSVARVKASNSNGVFDCRVLSRNHALLWYENSKFYLKDIKSSNGTFVNNQRLSKNGEESLPHELASGDILQFGVNVQTDTKKMTHGCIVAVIRLFLPDGTEAKACPSVSMSSKVSTVTPLEIYQLQTLLQEAGYREQLVQDKLLVLQELLATLEKEVAKSWNKMLDEETMLKRFEILEAKLTLYSKNYQDSEIKEELIRLREERANFEAESKERLQNMLNDKAQAVSKYCEMGRTCTQASTEAERMRKVAEACKLKEKHLITKLSKQAEEIEELTRNLRRTETKLKQTTMNQENHHENEASENAQLLVHIECLKAERDITLEQLAAFKSKYENLKNSAAVHALSECTDEELASQEAEVSQSYDSLRASVMLFQKWLCMLLRDIRQSEIVNPQTSMKIKSLESEEQESKAMKETLEGFKMEHYVSNECNGRMKTNLLKQIKQLESDLVMLSDGHTTNFEDHTNTIVRAKKKNINEEEIKDKENNEMIIPLEKDESCIDKTLTNFDALLNGKTPTNTDHFEDISSYIQSRIFLLKAEVEACDKTQEESPNQKLDIEGDLSHQKSTLEKTQQQLLDAKIREKEREAVLSCQKQYVDSLTEIKSQLEHSMEIVHSHLTFLAKRASNDKEQVVKYRDDIVELSAKLNEAETLAQDMTKQAESLKSELQQIKEEAVSSKESDEELMKITTKYEEQKREIEELHAKLVTTTEAYEELKSQQSQSFGKVEELDASQICDVQCTKENSSDALNEQLSSLLVEHEKLKAQLSSRDEDLSDLALQNQIVLPTWVMLVALFIAICWSGISS